MPISINPIFPVIAAQGAAPDVVLQPGTVIDAQVLKILANDLVRIAIANLSIEVLSEIPLQVGQTLQLAVSQTPAGIKLAVVGRGFAQGSEGIPVSTDEAAVSANAVSPSIVSPDLATPAAKVTVSAAAKPVTDVTPPKNPLTPLEALAVSAAAQTAATRQGSLAPLFANLSALAVSDALTTLNRKRVFDYAAKAVNLPANLRVRHGGTICNCDAP